MGISGVILFNSVLIGMEQTDRAYGRSNPTLDFLEHVCLAIYTIELLLNLLIDPFKLFSDVWMLFDSLIVTVGVYGFAMSAAGENTSKFGSITILRTLRLMRLARTIKLLKRVRVLWMLVKGLMESVATMANTLILLLIVMYLFSCISMEIITTSELAVGDTADPEFKEIVDKYFCNIPTTMLTLVQFLTLDSIGAIYKPLTERQPLLVFYFAAVILIVSIVILNLVTAVIVTDALNGARNERLEEAEQETRKRKRFVANLRNIFHRVDIDGSGLVTSCEFLKLSDEDLHEVITLSGINEPAKLFQMIDLDDSGGLDIDEFCEGLWHIMVDKVPMETRRLERRVELMYERMRLSKRTEICLLEAVGELVACQQAFLDSRKIENKLGRNVKSLENLLQELTESLHSGQQPRKANDEKRMISGLSMNTIQRTCSTNGGPTAENDKLLAVAESLPPAAALLARKQNSNRESTISSGSPAQPQEMMDCSRRESGAETLHFYDENIFLPALQVDATTRELGNPQPPPWAQEFIEEVRALIAAFPCRVVPTRASSPTRSGSPTRNGIPNGDCWLCGRGGSKGRGRRPSLTGRRSLGGTSGIEEERVELPLAARSVSPDDYALPVLSTLEAVQIEDIALTTAPREVGLDVSDPDLVPNRDVDRVALETLRHAIQEPFRG